MKKLLLFFTLCLFLQGANAQFKMVRVPLNQVSAKNVQTKAVDTPEAALPVGFCTGTLNENVGGVGTGGHATFSTAIQLSKEMLKGTQIYAIRFALGCDGKDLNVFISKDLKKDPAYTQPATIQNHEGWNYIILDTPYTITDGDTYVGYSIDTRGYSITMEDAATANIKGDWVRIDNTPWGSLSQQAGIKGSWAIQAIVTGGDYAAETQYDMAIESVLCRSYVKKGQDSDLGGIVTNYGVKTINSFDITYKTGDAAEVKTETITDVAIPCGMSYKFKLPKQVFAAEGKSEIELTVANLNGNQDQVTTNDKMNFSVECLDNFYDRKILVEQYTGQGCGFCPWGEATLRSSLKSLTGKYAWAAHHTYYTDDFTITESSKFANFFGTAGAAPYCAIDRTANQMSVKTGVVFDPRATSTDLMNLYLDVPTYVSVDLEGTTFDNATRTLSVKVSGEFLKELPNAKLNVFLTEDGLVGEQASAEDDYVHDHVMRAVISSMYGDDITLENGKYTKTYTFEIPQKIKKYNCEPENMTLAAFVADYNKSNAKACNVHNVETVTLKELGAVSAIDNTEMKSVAIYSENGTVYVDGEYNEISVYSMSGTLVKQLTKENSFSLENGLYIIKVVNGNNSSVQKVTVNK